MTVLDTSGLVDFLLGDESQAAVAQLLRDEGRVGAPELVVFEVIAVLRRQVLRGDLEAQRAAGAIEDLGDFPVDLYPALPLRQRVWELRASLTAADAIFVALAEQLEEPLATKDRHLAAAARTHTGAAVIELV